MMGMKRILHIVGDMDLGGAETMIMNLYRNIDRNSVQFDFLEYGSEDYYYDNEIKELGGILHRIKDKGSFYERILAHYQFFKKHPEYDVYHIHLSGATGIQAAVVVCARKLGIKKVILHSHTTQLPGDVVTWKMKLKHSCFKQIMNLLATDYLACSEAASNFMFSSRITKKKTCFLYNPIDINKFDYNVDCRKKMRNKFKINESTMVIGHVGRFDKVKNHKFLVEIFAKINKMQTDSVLILCGDGVLKENIEDMVENMGLNNNVCFLGIRDDVNDILQMCDCFVFPSLFEGLGISAIEAQVSGLPTFVSENVPQEVDVTQDVVHLSLKESPEIWAKEILKSRNHIRKSNKNFFVGTSYDINNSLKELMCIYTAR